MKSFIIPLPFNRLLHVYVGWTPPTRDYGFTIVNAEVGFQWRNNWPNELAITVCNANVNFILGRNRP